VFLRPSCALTALLAATTVSATSVPAEFKLLAEKELSVVCSIRVSQALNTFGTRWKEPTEDQRRTLDSMKRVQEVWLREIRRTNATPADISDWMKRLEAMDDEQVVEQLTYCARQGMRMYEAMPEVSRRRIDNAR
jgi:hypothetical protein